MAVSIKSLQSEQRRSLFVATLVAMGVYLGFRFLPTGTNLSHMDFRPGGNSVEMCDPANPQFIPVVSVQSPVTLTLNTTTARLGEPWVAELVMKTASGRPIGPSDLAVVHTEKLHLLVIDPTLQDYQHLHPQPTATDGGWEVRFTPRKPGTYRLFADFTPLATGRGLYGYAEVTVSGEAAPEATRDENLAWSLTSAPVVAGRPATLVFSVRHANGAPVVLEPVMGAFAHLVAFDQARLGYAHLHPLENDPAWRPDPQEPKMTFSVTIPSAGDYVVWAQLKIDGVERVHAFPLRVQ